MLSILVDAQNTTTFKEITVKDGLPSNLVYSFVKDKNGYIWFATDNGISKYNGTSFKNFSIKDGLPTNDIFELNIDSKNRIWLDSYQNGLFYIKNDTVKLVKNSLMENGYRFLFEKSDTVFIGSNYENRIRYTFGNKMFFSSIKNKEKLNFDNNYRDTIKNLKKIKNESFIKNKNILNIIENDTEKWIIDKGNKLYLLKDTYINNKYKNAYSSIGILNHVNYLNNNIAILNKNLDLYLYNLVSKKLSYIKTYTKTNHNLNILKISNKFIISNIDTKDIIEIKQDGFEFKSVKTPVLYSYRSSDNIKEQIYSLYIRKVLVSPNNKHFIELDKLKLRLNNIRAIDKKNIIVSNENGIHNINSLNKAFKSNFNIKNTITLSKDSNNILVGTTKDFYVLDKQLNIIKKFNLNTKVNCIAFEEKSNSIFLATLKGIILIEIINGVYQVKQIINEFDGVSTSSIKQIVPRAKNILVIQSKGFSTIDWDIFKKELKGEIEVLKFKVNDSIFNHNKKIVLERSFNNINIENSIKTKSNIANFNKFYKLTNNNNNNNENDWIEFKESNLKFSELNQGDYTLKIALIKTDSNIFSNVETISFSITPYIWERNSFILLLIFAAILTTIFLANQYRKKRLEKYLLINKLNILEMKAIKSQMNPHFIFNSLNNIQSSFLLDDEVKSNKIFVNFSKLLRTTLEMSNTEFTTLKKEINYIKQYLSVIQSNHDTLFDVFYSIEENLDLSKIKIPVLILQPIIENAIEHGLLPSKKEKIIQINIYCNSKKTIKIEIIDNGVGRNDKKIDKLKEQKSYGTSIIKNRIELLNKINNSKFYSFNIIDLKNHSTSKGTKVEIIIPIIGF
ncbi:MAG: histidine kinase [Polaribacter sp.]|uniref:sensor histidine kinase n=1 Tax=Polaribacter sp. TaxID=1920175 RepID=UPI002F35BB51